MDLEFFDTPRPFLDAAGGLLAADPVLGSVIASVTERTARELDESRDSWAEVDAPFERWWLAVRDDSGAVVSAAMRTAPFKPYPTFALPMTDEAAVALATELHERGEFLGGANGALPGAEVLAPIEDISADAPTCAAVLALRFELAALYLGLASGTTGGSGRYASARA